MKKVLMIAGQMQRGGLETMLMNFFYHIDRSKVSFDFMLNYEQPGFYDDEIRRLGGKIYIVPRLKIKNLFSYIKTVNKFFKEHKGEYDIVHGHLTSVGLIYLLIAKIHGIKCRIIHAHYTDTVGNHHAFLERLMLLPLRFCADYYFACSDEAGAFCYGKNILKKSNYKLIKNAVDVDKFAYNETVRSQMRLQLNISDKYAILNVGRFEEQKNHRYLVKLFSKVYERDNNCVLLLVGEGSLTDEIKLLVSSLKIEGVVQFLGVRNDVPQLLQAADVFFMPSLFEGLPVVGVEAQTAGLPCIFADTITTQTDITGNCRFVPLGEDETWVDELLAFKNYKRSDISDKIRAQGYDIVAQTKWLEDFYLRQLL